MPLSLSGTLGERRRIYQTLQISISVPKDGEIKIKLPFPDEEDFCRKKTVSIAVSRRQNVLCQSLISFCSLKQSCFPEIAFRPCLDYQVRPLLHR